ncbi:MAG: large-conductance mechanosensitive channel protein MscL [Clostridia bacterium]|nr:large-conductance mechanosensitive channel protein MscL [Clostridia bacterium]
MKLWEEFKKFAFKGNVIDMAVGVVVGGVFSKIVTSLVNDIIMPPIGLLIGGVDFAELKLVLKEAVGETAAVTINYGNFIQTIINFLIVGFSVFFMVKLLNKGKEIAHRKEREEAEAKAKAEAEAKAKAEAEEAAKPKPPTTEELLTEIRDLLAKNK